MLFKDRESAGKQLAASMMHYAHEKDAIVLGLPRGGVVVAYEVAKALYLPLDVICPRKIGAPSNPEFAIGAITETGEGIFNDSIIEEMQISKEYLEQAIESEKQQALRRLHLFRKNRPPRNLKDKIVIIVDDGLATGSTMLAAVKSVKHEGAKKIVVAVPVAPWHTAEELQVCVDEVICLATPSDFMAIGQFYQDFDQVEDEEVVEFLDGSPYTNC